MPNTSRSGRDGPQDLHLPSRRKSIHLREIQEPARTGLHHESDTSDRLCHQDIHGGTLRSLDNKTVVRQVHGA